MDIGKVVKYEKVHEVRVTFPNSTRYLGLTVGIRSASSEKAKAMIRKQENDRRLKSRGRQVRYTAENSIQDELEQLSSCIEWWRWEKSEPSDESVRRMAEAREKGLSEEEIAALDDSEMASYNGKQPEFNMEIACEILDKVNFLYAQLRNASNDVENFM